MFAEETIMIIIMTGQVKQSILNMEIYCPPEASVLLASYAVQVRKVLRSNDCLLQCFLKETMAVILLVQTQYTCQKGQQSMTILMMRMLTLIIRPSTGTMTRALTNRDFWLMRSFCPKG